MRCASLHYIKYVTSTQSMLKLCKCDFKNKNVSYVDCNLQKCGHQEGGGSEKHSPTYALKRSKIKAKSKTFCFELLTYHNCMKLSIRTRTLATANRFVVDSVKNFPHTQFDHHAKFGSFSGPKIVAS